MIEQEDSWQQLHFEGLVLSWRRITLHLKRNFTTAHSTSLTRKNFFVKVQQPTNAIQGYGQCGLPPKKPHCYLADINDCQNFMSALRIDLQAKKQKSLQIEPNKLHRALFEDLPPQNFSYCHPNSFPQHPDKLTFINLLIILNCAKDICIPEFKAAMSALQFAIFDFWSKIIQKPLTQFIFPLQKSHVCSSFYTLSYQDPKEMIGNALQSLQYTPFIKIKYIDDIPGLFRLLQQLEKISAGNIRKYIVDANASWSVDSAQIFNQTIQQNQYQQLRDKILYLQQPFPVCMNAKQQQQWVKFKQRSVVKIVVDQSFAGPEDIQTACKLGHGVNIKTEKTGGPINALKAAQLAKQNQLQIMLGSMVSTHLGSTQTYCLHPLTQWLDVDGSLLTASPSMKGGFEWDSKGWLNTPQLVTYGVQIQWPKQL